MSARDGEKKERAEVTGNDQADGESHNSFGDEGGTRVGEPDEPRRENLGAGSSASAAKNPGKPVNDSNNSGSTGSGSEAARGVHSANQGGDATKAGSEPLPEEREQEHKSGYGGEGGAPRTSSDQR